MPEDKHFRLAIGVTQLSWEQHSEFTTYTWEVPVDVNASAFHPSASSLATPMRLVRQPGPVLVAVDLNVVQQSETESGFVNLFDQTSLAVPYIHGARLRRYSGKVDQIKRIIDLLKEKESTRAVAVLVDSFRDFGPAPAKEEFASFCLVEFRRRTGDGGAIVVDAIAFYRAQEFARWSPIKVAELRLLQREIGMACGFSLGRITTVAADARAIARSPTHVAMPLIDRLLDQAPEKLHLLATPWCADRSGMTAKGPRWRVGGRLSASFALRPTPLTIPTAFRSPSKGCGRWLTKLAIPMLSRLTFHCHWPEGSLGPVAQKGIAA